jgi:hypothetical protein
MSWPAPDPVSLKEISATTGLHPSTAHRILNDLALGRYVDRPEAGSYRLGMRLLELGNLVKARLDVRDAALGPMRELHKLTHQPVNLSVRQGDEIVYIERTYSERSGMQVVRAVGGRAPLHLTSVGKLFLAFDDPQRVRAYATRTGLAGHTRNSITALGRLGRGRGPHRRPGPTVERMRGPEESRTRRVPVHRSWPPRREAAEGGSSPRAPTALRPRSRSPSVTVADGSWDAAFSTDACATGGCTTGACATTGIASSQRRMRSASPTRV